MDPRTREATLDGAPLDLSPTRVRPAALPGRPAGRGVTKRELLTEVWQIPYGGADKTVDVHLSWLRRKLGETAPRPRYLQTVRGVGIRAGRAGMRRWLALLVAATTSLVLSPCWSRSRCWSARWPRAGR